MGQSSVNLRYWHVRTILSLSLKLTGAKHWKISLMLSYALWIIGQLLVYRPNNKRYDYKILRLRSRSRTWCLHHVPFCFCAGLEFLSLFKSARQSRDYEEKEQIAMGSGSNEFLLLGVALDAFPAIIPTALLAI